MSWQKKRRKKKFTLRFANVLIYRDESDMSIVVFYPFFSFFFCWRKAIKFRFNSKILTFCIFLEKKEESNGTQAVCFWTHFFLAFLHTFKGGAAKICINLGEWKNAAIRFSFFTHVHFCWDWFLSLFLMRKILRFHKIKRMKSDTLKQKFSFSFFSLFFLPHFFDNLWHLHRSRIISGFIHKRDRVDFVAPFWNAFFCRITIPWKGG